jgi:hypothetical protein
MLLYSPVRNESFEGASGKWRDEIFPRIVSICTGMEEATALRNVSTEK